MPALKKGIVVKHENKNQCVQTWKDYSIKPNGFFLQDSQLCMLSFITGN